jgi:hypothetical protein
VDVAPQKQSIRWLVQSAVCKRLDVGRFKCGQGPLTGDGTLSPICVRHDETKRALAKPWSN